MLFMSTALFATSLFTPLFVQGVIGSSATQSGTVLAPMMLAFVGASVLIGQLLARVGRYLLVGLGGLLLAAIGQVPIVMRRELDGFIMNRLQGAVLHEALDDRTPLLELPSGKEVGAWPVGPIHRLTKDAKTFARVEKERVVPGQRPIRHGDLTPPGHPELLPQSVGMSLRRSCRDAESRANLVVRTPRCDQRDDFPLTRSDRGWPRVDGCRHEKEPSLPRSSDPFTAGCNEGCISSLPDAREPVSAAV